MVLDARRRKDRRRCRDARVWLDGVDVSHDCVKADPRRGYVLVLDRAAHGRFVREPDGTLAQRVRRGRVTWSRRHSEA
jgi:hypothetical protein